MIKFKSVEKVDRKLKLFNKSLMQYTDYHSPKKSKEEEENFTPRVYFTRQVREVKEEDRGYIDILHEEIYLLDSYINYFVLGEWNLKKERLFICYCYEKDKTSKIIERLDFKINKRSKEKCKDILTI